MKNERRKKSSPLENLLERNQLPGWKINWKKLEEDAKRRREPQVSEQEEEYKSPPPA